MKIQFSITAKLSILIVFMVALTAIAINEVYVRGSKNILIAEAILSLENEADTLDYPLSGLIDQLKDDAKLLASLQRTGEMVGLIRDKTEGDEKADEAEERIMTSFMEMLETREHYLEIQFVDAGAQGRELLKARQVGARIERVPNAKLQNLEDQKYFQDTLNLGPDDIYLSEPRLQRENGQIIEPYVLVLSAASPVYNGDSISGMIIVTMDFGGILQTAKNTISQNRIVYITDDQGNYLVHPDPAMLYGTMVGRDARLQKDQPDLIAVMHAQGQNRATLLPEDLEKGYIHSFHKYHHNTLAPQAYIGVSVEAPYREVTNDVEVVERRGLIFSIIVAFITALCAVFLLRVLIRPLNQIVDAVVRYGKGEKDIALPESSSDEIGVLSREFLNMMEQRNKEDWIRENLVTISRGVLGFKNLHDFAGSFVHAITAAVNAHVGVLYVYAHLGQYAGQDEEALFLLLGASGYKERPDMPQSFKLGEGLIGQCALDKNIRIVSDIPDDYVMVSSALGESSPKTLIIVPILFENMCVGVIELASLGTFTQTQRAFLEQISFNVGVIINSISAGMKTEELLEEARQTAEELQRNEEELKTQQEELEASNEEMEEKTRALEEQNTQIRRQSLDLKDSQRLLEEKARELELSSKYKSEFLANMSHELRTPLNSLLILARSLSSNEEGNLTEEQVEEARIIHNGGLELLNLINDILDLSKVEAGKLSIITDDTPISGMMRRLEQQFDPIAKERGVSYVIDMADNLPQTIHTDAQRVEQILKNLLSNAFKFTERGSVTIAVSIPEKKAAMQRTSLRNASVISFSVIDTGIGIEESKLNDIFEAFQQEDGATDRHYGGTGLGLTIARKFAHMLGGEIHVSSKKGEGSIFTLILPAEVTDKKSAGVSVVVHEASKALPKMPELPAITNSILDDRDMVGDGDKVLLIIEDDKDFARTLMKTAQKRGYKCLTATSGKNGLLMAHEGHVSAILLDLRLPDMDGIDVLDQLKHDLKTRHIPVHIITGMPQSDNVVPLRKGAIGYTTKPVRTEDIDGALEKIENLLKSEIKKILVVEDDRKTQAAIQSLLKKKDVEIECESFGGAALDLLKSQNFDCIILDLQLPDMTGFEWLESVERQMDGKEPPPVIVYTAKDLTEDENRRLNLYTGSIVIKGASSSERLLDEVTLFLHSVESTLTKDQQDMIRMQHDPDRMLQGRKVLLVDDDLRNTFALSKMLRKRGMNVIIADNGQMALDKLKQEKGIELIMMDIMMPIMDGYQAMQKIREDNETASLPIIALTARAMPEEQARCLDAGANDYMIKPVDVDRLLTLIRVWLFRQQEVA